MLKSLFIQNYALIDQLNISFEPGFSVITGETGAGKSIILGAIGLLLGQRADSRSIKTGENRCVIEASFNLSAYGMEKFFETNDLDFDGTECIIRRELTANGKSRAFVNDTPTQLPVLKELGEHLIDVHSQHQNLLLSKENFQINILDILSSSKKALADYKTSYSLFKKKKAELKQLIEFSEKNQADKDYIEFQLQQLDELAPQEGEQAELEQESELLSHAEEIKTAMYETSEQLSSDDIGIIPMLKKTLHSMESLQNVYPAAEELASRLQECYIELRDIASEVDSAGERIEYNPQRLQEVDERLSLIYSLQKKHHVESVESLIEIADDFRKRLNSITSGSEQIDALKKEIKTLQVKVNENAAQLTSLRQKAAKKVELEMQKRLVPLGIPNVRFAVEIVAKEPDETGADKVTFLFSANKNGALQNVAQVASGGEIARVMLSLKAMISGAVKLPTIIFDEIDTGVSGSIAESMAHIMREMGTSDRQVISITHLPQIAAIGANHYKVYKEDIDDATISHIIRLSDEQRVEEIAHMLSGTKLTDAAINNAKELLSQK